VRAGAALAQESARHSASIARKKAGNPLLRRNVGSFFM
jgi:hypothetical protein